MDAAAQKASPINKAHNPQFHFLGVIDNLRQRAPKTQPQSTNQQQRKSRNKQRQNSKNTRNDKPIEKKHRPGKQPSLIGFWKFLI